jgi:MoaA/NifB/PqqE/SkfB family radical SAM enzyme
MLALPNRLNLSIGHSCFVRCAGCYSKFGRTAPDLARFELSVARFVECGIRAVTVSGGDPLRIPGLVQFLGRLRAVGIESIKVDTVGTALLPGSAERVPLADLLDAADIVGLPLDGWSEQSVRWFREGRPRLFGETLEIIEAVRQADARCDLYLNTVLHRLNVTDASRILDIVRGLEIVRRWNIFQYTPTDQARSEVNDRLAISDATFTSAARQLRAAAGGHGVEIECASVRDRVGKYLLVNSGGDAWMPDIDGRTVPLGNVCGREREVLLAWRDVSEELTCLVR